MVTKNELRIVETCARRACSSSFCVIDANWDEEAKLLKTKTSKWKTLRHRCLLALNWIWVVHGIWRLEKIFVSKSETFGIVSRTLYIVSTSCNVTLFLCNNAFAASSRNLIILFNQLLVINYKSGILSKETSRAKWLKYSQFLLLAVMINALLILVMIDIHYIWIISSGNLFFAASFTLLCAVSISMISSCIMVGFVQMYVFLYFANVKETLTRLDDETVLNAELVDKMVQDYRSLTIICNFFNHTYCRFLAPVLKYGASIVGMIFVVLAVQLKRNGYTISYGLLVITVYPYILVAVAGHMTSGLWLISSKFIWNFQQRSNHGNRSDFRKYMNCVVKSFLPLRFGIGGMYYMEKAAKGTLVNFLIAGTVNVLLALDGYNARHP